MMLDTKMIPLQLITIIILLGIVQNQEPIQYSNCGQLGPNTTIPFLTNAHRTNHWPWHAAVYHQLDEVNPIYKCGGTLINSRSILTAAHCVVFNNVPLNGKQVSVSLGRLNLGINEASAQSIEVAEIVAHENYSSIDFAHDIAIIKLSAHVIFNNYVKPICLWKTDKIDLGEVIGQSGTVVGFGLTEQGVLSNILQEAALPIISTFDCLKSNPHFFGPYLSKTNFCAGLRNGTSVCTGDSGGSMTFKESGLYYIRGIVSIGSSVVDRNTSTLLCDSTQFALFTDVAQYLPWIRSNLFGCETNVRCDWDINIWCKVFRNVTLSAQDCDITIDETSNTAVTRLSVTGETDFIPKFTNVATKFVNLEELYLKNIRLKSLARDRLTVFRNIKWLDVSNNEIIELNSGTFDDLKTLAHLEFDGNGLKKLHGDLFKELPDLEYLSLRHNNIEILPADIFRGNVKLKILHLVENQLTGLHSDIFKDLENLENLYLNLNKIETLPADIFRGNVKMQNLYLSYNQLTVLHSDIFKELQNLEILYVDANKIETLPTDIFRHNTKIQFFSISYNQLRVLHSDIFKDLQNLEALEVTENRIETLPPDIFRNNKMLKHIVLNYNKLKELPSSVFQSLENLEILHLEGNKIETLPEDIFRYNTKMHTLFLYDNPLKDLHSDFFSGLRNLQRLYLSREKNELDQQESSN